MNLKLNNPLAFLDLETTGINIVNDRIIELAIVKLMPNGAKIYYEKRINPGILIPQEASLVHGIYDADVSDLPLFKQIAQELLLFLQGCDLAGFNVLHFDIPVLVESFLREGIDSKLDERKVVDVQKIFHLMEKRTLKAAYQFYCNKELEGAHSAMVDALATTEILVAQVKKYENKEVKDTVDNVLGKIENNITTLHALSSARVVDLAGRIVYNRDNIPIFNFGKYKGKKVAEVFYKEPSYYAWIMQGDFPLNTKRKFTQIKLGATQN